MTTNEMLTQRIYWITKADAAGIVKIIVTRPFDTSGNNSIDWTTQASGLRLSHRMHLTQATERLANHREYRRGTTEEMNIFRQTAETQKAEKAIALSQPAATERQLDYLVILGVELPLGRRLTKAEASTLIDAAKDGRSGESLGSFSMFYADGSN